MKKKPSAPKKASSKLKAPAKRAKARSGRRGIRMIYTIPAFLLLFLILIYNPISVRLMTIGVAVYYKIDPVIFYRLIRTESSFRSLAVSPRRAIGLGQVKQSTAKFLDDDHRPDLLYTPLYNLKVSARYIKYLKERFNGNWSLVLAAYNWGETVVEKRVNGRPIDSKEDYREWFRDVPETYHYIEKIMGPSKKA